MVMVLRIMPPSLAAASLSFLRICGCRIVLPSQVRRAVEGLTVPIRDILKVEYGPVFEAEEVASLTAAFDAALSKLGLVDRKDPMSTTVAKLIIQLATAGRSRHARCRRRCR